MAASSIGPEKQRRTKEDRYEYFRFFKTADIHKGLKEYAQIENAVLLDVRTPQEYSEGHIPESINVPLQTIDKVTSITENKDTALYVYCYSGVRSRQATAMLQNMGYSNVQNIGGIAAYHGKVER